MSHRPLPLLVVALTAVGLVGVACTLNPQPLPPGDDRDTTSATPTPTEDPSGGTAFGDASSPPNAKDAGTAPPDAGTRDGSIGDASSDSSTDASDAATDSSTDATRD